MALFLVDHKNSLLSSFSFLVKLQAKGCLTEVAGKSLVKLAKEVELFLFGGVSKRSMANHPESYARAIQRLKDFAKNDTRFKEVS